MPGNYNSDGVNVDNFFAGPDGEYVLTITDAVPGSTQNGDPKVTVDYIIAEGPSKGLPISFHTVVFFKDKLSKGAGIAIKFLKCIGEPWEGNFAWDERNWIGKKVKAMIMMEEAAQGKHKGKKFPRIQWVNPPDGGQIAAEDVPF